MKAEEKKEGVEVEVEVGIEMKAMEALGKGFDLTSDFRLKFAKGTQRLVVVDEFNNRDILIPAGPTIPAVPLDIRCDKGDRLRFKSDVLQFNQVPPFLILHLFTLPSNPPFFIFFLNSIFSVGAFYDFYFFIYTLIFIHFPY